MRRLLYALLALLSHWRRHPGNFAALFVGLALATALFAGVEALNAKARASYAEAASLVDEASTRSLVAPHGGLFPQELYVRLRRAGWKVSPVLEGTLRVGDSAFTLLGVDPITAPSDTRLRTLAESAGTERFLKGPGVTLLAESTLHALSAREGDRPQTERSARLPPLVASPSAPPGYLIVDIGVAQELLDRPGLLSRLVMEAGAERGAPPLASVVGEALRLQEREETPGLEKLTESFHLNLSAFGALAFLVGLFIAYAANSLAFAQRLPTIRTLRAIGVSARALSLALLFEALLFGLVAGALGLALGRLIAAALLPDVAASLESLYGAHLDRALPLEPRWAALALGVALLGAVAAASSGLLRTLRLPVNETARPQARPIDVPLRALAGLLALAAALATLSLFESLAAAFAVVGLLALGAILLFPALVAGAMRLGEAFARGPLAQWFWAECRAETPVLALALGALLLALATNIGVGAMVEGFRDSFVSWLDERLVAEAYLEAASDADAARIAQFLATRAEVQEILPTARTPSLLAGWPVEVFGLKPSETYRAHFPTLAAKPDAWERIASGQAALASEQLARRLKLELGATIELPTPQGAWPLEIVGIYPDYGNPEGQIRVDLDALAGHWPQLKRVAMSLRVAPQAAPNLLAELRSRFGPALTRAMDQANVKALSLRIFDHTFAVTAALGALTLFVSSVALFASLATLSNMRLLQLAPLFAIGVTRGRLALFELARVLALACATALCALPLGLAMAWVLVAEINVRAFGWRLPYHVFPGQWMQMLALALLAALFSAALPALRLARTPPAALLKAFEDDA
ncbi:FtsX-like permease family protein [Methylocystis bryophila]|uniref:ABC transporter permease n=1 Tax=Methylocystis bryophila TaxID=655015 RepID=A0A1W6MUK1_9HYPH|nr:FtsX-like permease family protein [Methylocystis bryophila]ARN81255.1 ABC transporter permease [Methylocystis bryophila]BDV37208.1 ABC transporter permease [Methylocystis bryophila]